MIKLIEQHFEATVKRGLINDKTCISDFVKKMDEEDQEVLAEIDNYLNPPAPHNLKQELIDAIMVRVNMLIHIGGDVEEELIINVLHQQNRND